MYIHVNPTVTDQLRSLKHRADALARQTKSFGDGPDAWAELAALEDDLLRLMQVEQAHLQGEPVAARRN